MDFNARLRKSQQRTHRRRIRSRISNIIWSIISVVVVLIAIAAIAYGCMHWVEVMGTEV